MKLKSVSVKKLFGMYDYTIDLFLNENITIIDALNGKGKTTVSKLIKATVEGDIYTLDQIPFTSFLLSFDNDDMIEVKKIDIYKSVKDINVSNLRKRVAHQNSDLTYENMEVLINSKNYCLKFREDILMMFIRRGRVMSRDAYYSGGEVDMSIADLMDEGMANDIFECEELISELTRYKKNLSIHFIKADRLFQTQQTYKRGSRQEREEKISSVEKYSREIKEKITSLGKKFGDESEKLDRTFPKRVIDGIFQNVNDSIMETFEKDQIISNLDELETRRHELSELGLITETNDSSFAIPEDEKLSRDTRVFLTKYIEDNIIKLDIYKELAIKLDLLKTIVNVRNGFSNKEMRYTKNGVVFINAAEKEIPIEHLSSGEKNDFVLFYELIFKCDSKSLILVDEPEISLHVAWQQEFIDELMEICKLKNMQAIVATHSPNIVNNHWDLLVDLEDENYENE